MPWLGNIRVRFKKNCLLLLKVKQTLLGFVKGTRSKQVRGHFRSLNIRGRVTRSRQVRFRVNLPSLLGWLAFLWVSGAKCNTTDQFQRKFSSGVVYHIMSKVWAKSCLYR